MSDPAADRSSPAATHPLKRRGLLIGAGAVGAAGAAALAVKALPGVAPVPAAAAAAVVADTGGYRLSAHVLRYYETTRA